MRHNAIRTLFAALRAQGRAGRHEIPFEDLSEQPEERNQRPDDGLAVMAHDDLL